MYDHTRQYRCEIIRGKSQSEMDDLLPAYAKVIDEICPCPHEDFETLFNNAFARFLPESNRIKKTFDNHRTEISGKLFGMYYFCEDGMVYESERTQKFLADNDQPAFFKDMCYKLQFPNGMQKTSPTVMERVHDGINLRPNAFVLKLLQVAQAAKVPITKKTIGYYVLNSLDVLQGKATPYEVIEVIVADQKDGLVRQIHAYDEQGREKASSYRYQHINEQLNYLELANLIRFVDNELDHNDKRIVLNPNEADTIDLFASEWNQSPAFDISSFDLSSVEKRKEFQCAWDAYFSKLSMHAGKFGTSVEALEYSGEEEESTHRGTEGQESGLSTVEIGDEGEALVFDYEKKRVAAFNARLANKVLSLGKTHGLGYDIQSVVAEPGDKAEFVKYIEVKSTKRLTCPNIDDNLWVDTLNITRNEWVAAQQHGSYFSIFRVYFTREGTSIFVLTNVASKLEKGTIQATPMTYRLDFTNCAVDSVIEFQNV